MRCRDAGCCAECTTAGSRSTLGNRLPAAAHCLKSSNLRLLMFEAEICAVAGKHGGVAVQEFGDRCTGMSRPLP